MGIETKICHFSVTREKNSSTRSQKKKKKPKGPKEGNNGCSDVGGAAPEGKLRRPLSGKKKAITRPILGATSKGGDAGTNLEHAERSSGKQKKNRHRLKEQTS